jgi:hypothetical protein
VLWVVWIGLGVGAVAIGVGVYRSVRGGIATFRALRDLQRGATVAADALAVAAEKLGGRPDPTQRLEPAVAQLHRSVAQLTVLVVAMQEVGDTAGRLLFFYPRK